MVFCAVDKKSRGIKINYQNKASSDFFWEKEKVFPNPPIPKLNRFGVFSGKNEKMHLSFATGGRIFGRGP
jgi:hypothetical protein